MVLKNMKHYIKDNIYYLEDIDGNVVLKIKLVDSIGNQIILETEKEIYSGPVELISFDVEPPNC